MTGEAAKDERYIWMGNGRLALKGEEGVARLEPGEPIALTPSQAKRGEGLMKEGKLISETAWRAMQRREKLAERKASEERAPGMRKPSELKDEPRKPGPEEKKLFESPKGKAAITSVETVELRTPSPAAGKGTKPRASTEKDSASE